MPDNEPEVPGYRLTRRAGEGGTAAVWVATHEASGDEVAIKLLRPGSDETVLRREATALTRIRHPHIVRMREWLRCPDGTLAVVLDYVPSSDLGRMVRESGPLDPGEIVTVLTPLAGALAHVHDKGLVHGDVTPANILFGQDGRPILCDLGLAAVQALETPEHGTTGFSDPDRNGAVSAADDVFGLGAVAWFALTGRTPPPSGLRPPLITVAPTLPDPVVDLVERCLLVDPTARPTAREVAVKAYDCGPSRPVRVRPDPGADPALAVTHRLRRRSDTPQPAADGRPSLRRAVPQRRWPPRSRRLLAVAVSVVLLVGGGVGAWWFGLFDTAAAALAGTPSAGTPSGTAGTPSPSGTQAPGSPTPAVDPQPTAPVTAAPTGSTGPTAGGGAAAEVEILAAVDRLSALRAAGFATGSEQPLRQADAAQSPALADDLALLAELSRSGVVLQDLSFVLEDARVVSHTDTTATVRLRTRTGAHTVVRVADSSVVQAVAPGDPRDVVLTLTRGGSDWQVQQAVAG